MELLIPGLILVALMVWASTKIKKNAAAAFEPELIETDEFSLVKPEGFLHPLNDESELAFTAYSKEFGHDYAEHVRRALIELQVFENEDLEAVCRRSKAEAMKVESEEFSRTGVIQTCLITAERDESGVTVDTFSKIVAANNKVYDLQVSVLPEFKAEYTTRIEELFDSFEIK